MSKVLKPKPCSSCGSKPKVIYKPLPYKCCWSVDCTNEECPERPGTWYYYERGDAVNAWNSGEVIPTRNKDAE